MFPSLFSVFLIHFHFLPTLLYAKTLPVTPLSPGSSSSASVQAYLTSCDSNGDPITLLSDDSQHVILSQDQYADNIPSSPTSYPTVNLAIDSSVIYQTILGFGGGIPQSSAYNLLQLKEYSVSTYNDVLMKLFDQESGAGINILRFPIGSCDFSMTNTSYDESYNDYDLTNFQVDKDSQLIIDLLLDILLINPNITLIASPWTAPSWLKYLNSLLGLSNENTLLSTKEAYEAYANYFKKTYEVFLEHGLTIHYFTLQNEPLFGDNKQYPGMYLSADDEYNLGVIISQLLNNKVKLLAYDHNWDHPEYPLEILLKQQQEKKEIFDGTAWHCYGGDMGTALTQINKLYPSTSQHITECTGSFPQSICDITQGMTSFGWNHEWDMKNLFLGATSYGSSSGTKWIMALDETCGPVLPGVEFTFGRPFVSIPLNLQFNITSEDIKWNQDYWTTAHMSKFISSGDKRIHTQVSPGNGNGDEVSKDILSETFVNEMTHRVTCILMNLNHEKEYLLKVSQENTSVQFQYLVPSWSTVIFQWYET